MAGCSAATILVKLSTRSGELNAFAVLAIATSIVAVSAIAYAISSGAFIEFFPAKLVGTPAIYAYAGGITLTIAVGSLFKGLSLGPASVVVPVYGMFILGAALLGIVILEEPFTGSKAGGLALAVIGIFLVAR
ncbi:MAG TPA: multidrug transporter [Sulfitobacter sp.]|jgi:transporter family protein|nr:multidrug transporter [Sulfitobacter sp.]|tara:strand:+ start:3783 stop:4181 length:399 start_codon:yes stop_codon:yes gene_type:complete